MKAIALATLHDRMTEQHFPCPIQSFSLGSISTPLNSSINILAEGRCALEKANQELGEPGCLGGRRRRGRSQGTEPWDLVSRVPQSALPGCLLGLALDSWDLDFYTKRFQELQRNPSTVEAFDLAQSNRWGRSGGGWGRSEV